MFVPSAGTVLVDWGADVVKVEHPVTGDPQRGLVTSGLLPGGDSGINFMMEQPNRGKRSVAIDIAKPGRPRGVHEIDRGRRRLPAAGAAQAAGGRRGRAGPQPPGRRGPRLRAGRGRPDAEKGGYDAASFWARGGVAAVMPTARRAGRRANLGGLGDVMGGLATAGAIAAALLQRERTGDTVVDVSLLATAMWQLSPMVVAARLG